MATPTDEEPNSSLDIKPSNTPIESADSPPLLTPGITPAADEQAEPPSLTKTPGNFSADSPNTAAQPTNDDKDEKIGLASLPEFQEKPTSIEIPAVASPDPSTETQPTANPSLTVPTSPTADKPDQEDNVKKTLQADEIAPINTTKPKVTPKPPAPTPKGQIEDEPKEEKQEKKSEGEKEKPEGLSWANLFKMMGKFLMITAPAKTAETAMGIKEHVRAVRNGEREWWNLDPEFTNNVKKFVNKFKKNGATKNAPDNSGEKNKEPTAQASNTSKVIDNNSGLSEDGEYRPMPSNELIQRLELATESFEAFRRNPAANDNDASLSETPSLSAHKQNYPSLKQLADMDAQNPIIRPTFADAHPEQFPNNDKEKEQRREQASIRQKKQAIPEVLPEQSNDNLSRPKVK